MSEKTILKRLILETRIPPHLNRRFITISDEQIAGISDAIKSNYFAELTSDYLSTAAGRSDLEDHLIGRLSMSRRYTIPWLDSAKRLDGARILEIGCGTGSSTAALAEQGAAVIGIDVDEKSLATARARLEILGLPAEFVSANAVDASRLFSGSQFDFIIFYASLEHMTHAERLTSMRTTWEMLEPGQLWVITETPNRLWFYDFHTSLMPFFMWLPDDLAFHYARFSPRSQFREVYREPDPESMVHFLRRGRGVSYHEFDLSMRPSSELEVVSDLAGFHRNRQILRKVKWRLSDAFRYTRFISRSVANLHKGFFAPRLDLIIRKT